MRAGVRRDAPRRIPRPRPPSPRSRSSCRRRRGRTACRRGASARTGRWPLLERAGRHHVGVAGEDEQLARRPARAAARPPTGCVTRDVVRAERQWSSHSKPSGARRAAISAWQPPSSGVTERRAISCSARRSVADIGAVAAGSGSLRSGAGSATRPTTSSGRTSSVISVKVGWSLCLFLLRHDARDRRHVVLQAPHQVGRRVGVGQAFVARRRCRSLIRRARSCSKVCEPSAMRLLHRFLDAGEVAFLDQLGHQLGVEHAPRPPACGRRRRCAAGAARRSRAGRRPGRPAAWAALPAGRSDRIRFSAW